MQLKLEDESFYRYVLVRLLCLIFLMILLEDHLSNANGLVVNLV